MPDTLTLVEYGNYVDWPFNPEYIPDLTRLSERWKSELGLSVEPFDISSKGAGDYEVRAQGVAGYIGLKDVSIEVKPKCLDKETANDWRSAFWKILSVTEQRSITSPTTSGKKVADGGIFDLLGKTVADGLSHGFRSGLPRGYVEHRSKLEVLRGRIDTSRIEESLTDPGKIPCIYDAYVEDTPANRLISWATSELAGQVSSRRLSHRLSAQSQYLESLGVASTPPGRIQADQISLSPQYSYLDSALEASKLLLRGKSLTFGSGSYSAPGFLWKTSDVFEQFVGTVIETAMDLKTRNLRVKYSSQELASTIKGDKKVETTPDFRIVGDSGTSVVADSKYKVWDNNPPSEDFYQVMAGCRVNNCGTGLLIYPSTLDSSESVHTWLPEGEGLPQSIVTLFIDLTHMNNTNGLKDLSKKFLSEMEEQHNDDQN